MHRLHDATGTQNICKFCKLLLSSLFGCFVSQLFRVAAVNTIASSSSAVAVDTPATRTPPFFTMVGLEHSRGHSGYFLTIARAALASDRVGT